jgi:TRAP transporter 4TM/12TM fusion protein
MALFKKKNQDNAPVNADKEGGSGVRKLSGVTGKIAVGVPILMSLFAIYVNGFTTTQEIYRNLIFLSLLLVMSFMLYPATKRSPLNKVSIFDYVLMFAGLAGTLYLLFNYTVIHVERNSQAIPIDYIFGLIAIVILLEAGRRTIGIFIPLLAVVAIVYAVYGPYFPGMFAHAGFTPERLLYRIYMTTEGVFGMTLSIASTYIVLFVLFGAFLGVSGASQLFNDLALAVAGKRRGGPAQVAVLSSALTGSLSGSAVANVATTGTFTIPLMKSIGLKPRFAAAVEATASTGGMIMPPIMGAAAFIMAGFLGVSYTVIIMAAIIPSLFYYSALSIAIDLEAKKQGMKGISKESIPLVKEVLKERGVLLLPIIIVIGTLLVGKTAMFAGFAGIISAIVASWLTFDKSNRIGLKKITQALEEGGRGVIQVGVACAAIGILIAVVTMTGLGSTIAYNIIELSGGVLWIILLLVMVTCIVLSMGLPSTALYIVVAVTAAPALVEAGVTPLAAHFFVFWFGALSNVTPPVALASYTAAGIAGADPMKTSWTAMKLSLPGFIIPFMIAYNPTLVMQSSTGDSVSAAAIITALVTGLIGIYALAIAINNFFSIKLNIFERIVFLVGSLMLIDPGFTTDVIGIGLVAVAFAIHTVRAKKHKEKGLSSGQLSA